MAAEREDHAAHWRERASCLHVDDPDLFFPVGISGLAVVQVDEAKAVCGRCPVTEQCLDWALHVVQVEGVWGGTTESERRAMTRSAFRQDKSSVTRVVSRHCA
ncbi:WhiB family transcriptional regulator [Streptomyces sp. NPDC020298]|uniref:WhiB family transcriptional regulator n=1 Tax=unclassified Streptomyces TaxID=2593676 RepID=UPI0033EE84CF